MNSIAKFKALKINRHRSMIKVSINQYILTNYLSDVDYDMQIKIDEKAEETINQFMENIHDLLTQSKNPYIMIENAGIYFGEKTGLYKDLVEYYMRSYDDDFVIYGTILNDIMCFILDIILKHIYKHVVKRKLKNLNIDIDEKESEIIIRELKELPILINFPFTE